MVSTKKDFFAGGGQTSALCLAIDWQKTSLGAFESWPQSLYSAVSICLGSSFPIAIYWGEDLTLLYNDAWSPIPGSKHPDAMGRPGREVWPEIWETIGPLFEQVRTTGKATRSRDQLLAMNRYGYTEECYFDYTFSPIRGEGGKVEGIFNAGIETTYRVISDRRNNILEELSEKLLLFNTTDEVLDRFGLCLARAAFDLPFCAVYDGAGNLRGHYGTRVGHAPFPSTVDDTDADDDPWLLKQCRSKNEKTTGRVPRQYRQAFVAPWPEPCEEIVTLPLRQAGRQGAGMMVCGISPRKRLDQNYHNFVSSVERKISNALNAVAVLEAERARAKSLAQLDKAKTVFFGNISHELRTPLTLIMGPLEQVLDHAAEEKVKMAAEAALLNARRLYKLVNTLLDFSRLEGGGLKPSFQPVDLAAVTRDLASGFRSVMEKGGLEFEISSSPLPQPVYVDLDLWEKVILNLLSNAFKFTLNGKVSLRVEDGGDHAVITLSDTGVGIPEKEINNLFKRFHRIEKSKGRTYEGTGIGLSLVDQLVKIHQGTITATSREGEGSTFNINLPYGRAHLSDEYIIEASTAYAVRDLQRIVEEESRLMLGNSPAQRPRPAVPAPYVKAPPEHPRYRGKILIADDNADLRDYILRILQHDYEIIQASDGEEALRLADDHIPDLIVSDVMMPQMDGFQLVRSLRSHPRLQKIPVIMLSAIAEEKSRIEGYNTGADDYLVKPFSARELLSKIHANIRIQELRRYGENQIRNLIGQAPMGMGILKGASFVVEEINTKALEIFGQPDESIVGRELFAVFPQLKDQPFVKGLHVAFETGKRWTAEELPVTFETGSTRKQLFLTVAYEPFADPDGTRSGVYFVLLDVTTSVLARAQMEASQQQLSQLANAMPQLVWMAWSSGEVYYYNERIERYAGAYRTTGNSWEWQPMIHPDDLEQTNTAWTKAVREKSVYEMEHRVQLVDGEYRWHLSRALPQFDENGDVIKWFGTATDIQLQKEAQELLHRQALSLEHKIQERTADLEKTVVQLKKSNEELAQFAYVASHDLQEPLRKIQTFTDLINNQLDDKDFVGRYLAKINRSAARMSSLVHDVLQYSLLNNPIEPEWVDLNEVLAQVKSDLELMIADKGGVVHASGLPRVWAVPLQMYQLMLNLVSNAIKYAERPPVVHVTAGPANAAPPAKSRHPRGTRYVHVQVTDNGIGINQQYQDKIFGIFQRLHTHHQYSGTGIGLALCKKIVDNHQGHISCRSVEGEGTVFDIYLPVP